MKIDLENLNWNEANVGDFRYIYYLAKMLDERTNKIKLPTQDFTLGIGSQNFNLSEYEPGGLFRFDQLYKIYQLTLWLGRYYFFNPNTLNNESFKNGKRVKHFGYTVDQLSQIANFDFYKNPLIPGQRLDFYNKFLKPLYLVLKEYKKVWINIFYGKDLTSLYHGRNYAKQKKVNNIMQELQNEDRINNYKLSSAIENEIELIPTGIVRPGELYPVSQVSRFHDNTFLGGLIYSDYMMYHSFGYYTTHWHIDPPGPGPSAGWEFNSGEARFNYDERDSEIIFFDGERADHIIVEWTATGESYGDIIWQRTLERDDVYKYHEDTDSFEYISSSFAPISDTWTSDPIASIGKSTGTITIDFNNLYETDTYIGTPEAGDTFSLTLSGDNYNEYCNVEIIYNESEGGGDNNHGSSGYWEIDGTEFNYARNYEGNGIEFYSVIPSTQILCPVPLMQNADYQLYMYSFQYPIERQSNLAWDVINSVHDKIRLQFYYPEIIDDYSGLSSTPTTNAWYKLYYWDLPSIQLQPFGNYFLSSSGTIENTFQCFDISLPQKLPYDDTIFNNYPTKIMGDTQYYSQVDYSPYTYDITQWKPIADTPSATISGTPLTPGKVLGYIGPSSTVNDLKKGTLIEWWYKPLLIVDYSKFFNF